MKILLLTDIPPCKNLTAGLVLDQLCRFLPKGSLACFAVINPGNYDDAQLSPDLSWIDIEYRIKPREQYVYFEKFSIINRFSFIKKCISFFSEIFSEIVWADRVSKEIISYAEGKDVDRIWAVLQGQTMIRLAHKVSEKSYIPLYTHIWDSQGWWLREHGVDSITKHRVLKQFETVIKKSKCCYAASPAMAEKYKADLGANTVSFLPSLDEAIALPPAKRLHEGDEFIIGLAGQLYAVEEWENLLDALDSVGWEICKRKVKIQVMGKKTFFSHIKLHEHVEFLGWGSQKETVTAMSKADLLYCPYWFDPTFETEARLSFPSKLTTYLASGRPVLFHGPEYASPAKFLLEHQAGMLCNTLDKSDIISSISELIMNDALYSTIAQKGRKAFGSYLTLQVFHRSFADFLKIDEGLLRPVLLNAEGVEK